MELTLTVPFPPISLIQWSVCVEWDVLSLLSHTFPSSCFPFSLPVFICSHVSFSITIPTQSLLKYSLPSQSRLLFSQTSHCHNFTQFFFPSRSYWTIGRAGYIIAVPLCHQSLYSCKKKKIIVRCGWPSWNAENWWLRLCVEVREKHHHEGYNSPSCHLRFCWHPLFMCFTVIVS